MIQSVPVRYGLWLGCLITVMMVWLQVRIEVLQLRKDHDRTQAAIQAAEVLNQRLQLEMDARRRLVEAEHIALDMGLTDDVVILDGRGARER